MWTIAGGILLALLILWLLSFIIPTIIYLHFRIVEFFKILWADRFLKKLIKKQNSSSNIT